MAHGDGVLVGLGGDGRAEELRNVEKKLARGLVGGEDERRRGLHGSRRRQWRLRRAERRGGGGSALE